jgi:hypothetical protein
VRCHPQELRCPKLQADSGSKSSLASPVRREQGRVMATKHVGFVKAAKTVSRREGYSMDRSRRIIAAGARNASPSAKRSNKNLLKVRGA